METTLPAPVPQPDHAVRVHHRFGCSKLNYLDACPGFTSIDGTSEAAEDGTRLHEIMDEALKLFKTGEFRTLISALHKVLESHASDDAEKELLLYCARELQGFIAKAPCEIHNEIDVQILNPDGTQLNHGYLDVLLLFNTKKGRQVGILDDFKFGFVPVLPASKNLQGMGYALGCFLKFPKLDRIQVVFSQPRLNWTSDYIYERSEMWTMYKRIRTVIDDAIAIQANPDLESSGARLRVGDQCDYCSLKGKCTAIARMAGRASNALSELPAPATFQGALLKTPEQIALARYWVSILEDALDPIKRAAFEAAEANGGIIETILPNGEQIRYKVQEKKADRVLGDTMLIVEALKGIVEPDELLCAAEFSIGKLETIVGKALQEQAEVEGRKLTKKASIEQFAGLLEAQGLLSRPDTRVRFLKREKFAAKQLNETNKEKQNG